MSKLWTVVKAAGNHPLPRAYHSAVEANGKIYVVGGKGQNDKALDSSLYILNTAGLKSWNLPKVTGVAPTPRHSHSATIVDNKIYIFGGHGERFLNDWFVLNCATLAWSQPRLNGSPPLPRSNHTATAFGKKIIVFGGACLNFSKSFNDLHIWDIEQLQWSTIQASGATPSPRFNHIAEVIDDKLYVIGGTDGKRLFNDVHILDLTNNVWSSPQTIGGIPGVSGASSFVHDRKIIFFGGETSNGVSDICFAFQPDNAQFCESKETVSRTGTAIAGRDGHRICCTSKGVVYLLGGRGPNAADLVVMYNLTPSTLTFETSSYVSAEGDGSIVISEVIQQGENSLITDIQRSEVLTSSGGREQASHNELLKLKANLDALKEKRDLVAKRAQQEAETPIDNVEFAKLSGEIQSLKDEVKNAKSTTEQSNAALAETNKKLEEANKKLAEKDAEINSLKSLSNEKNLLEQKILDLQSEVQSSKGSVSSDLQRISSLTHELELVSQEKANLKNTISELQFQIEQDSLRSTQSQTEHNLNIEKLEHQLASSSSEIQQINNSFEAQITELENTIRQLTEEKAEIKNSKDHEVAKLKQQIEQNMLQTIQNSSEQQLKEEFEKKFQEIDDERNSLLSEIATLNESHGKQLSELKSALSSLKNEHDQLQRTHGNLERQLAESNNQNESKSKFISQLEEQISSLSSKRSVQVEEFNAQIANYQAQITTLNDTVNGYQSQIGSLKSSSNNSTELKDKVAQIEAATAQQIQQLKEQFANTEEALTEELNTYKSQIEELQETLLNYHAEIERLNSDFQQQATELQARTDENKKLQNSLNTLAEQELSGGGSDIEVARYLEKIREQEEEISRLESEVEQWMTASEELQKLGEDAVAEITLEADRLRDEVNQWKKAVEEQTQRRREAEAELLNSESKLNDLDSMLRRLLGE